MEAPIKHKLLDMPQEVIDLILELLLPPITSRGRRLVLEKPHDLSMLASVCKFLYRIASPWMWRNATIDKLGVEELAFPVGSFPTQWHYLRDHPEVAKHIWHLSVTFWLRELSYKHFHHITSFMENLRLLDFSTKYPNDRENEVFTDLIRKPKLHTLIASCYYFHKLPIGITGIKRLAISSKYWFRQPDRQLKMMEIYPESLAIHGERNHISTLSIPWATLHHLAVVCSDVRAILRRGDGTFFSVVLSDFLSWRERNPDILSPLTTISFDCSVTRINSMWLSEFINVFGGQNLTGLHLLRLKRVDKTTVSQIVDTFPRLQSLLLYQHESDDLPASLEYLEVIGVYVNLPHLRSIYLGNVDLKKFDEEILQTVGSLANRCQKLELVHVSNHRHLHHSKSASYFIERGYDGLFLKCKMEVHDYHYPPQAGWKIFSQDGS